MPQQPAPLAARHLAHPRAIQAVFFDVGYTLLAPHPSVLRIAQAACAVRGIELAYEDLRAAVPRAELYFRATLRQHPATWSDERTIAHIWTGYYGELLRACLPALDDAALLDLAAHVARVFDEAASYALYPDVIPVLQALRQRRLTLGIISDWGISLGIILRHHDLIQYFDFAVISAAVRHSKPDPALFQRAIERARVVPDYAIHVGDAYLLDVLGARAAGITAILLDRKAAHDPAQLDCPVIRDLFGLLDLLDIPLPASVA